MKGFSLQNLLNRHATQTESDTVGNIIIIGIKLERNTIHTYHPLLSWITLTKLRYSITSLTVLSQ